MFGKYRQPKVLSAEEYIRQLTQLAYSGVRKQPTPYIGETLERGSDEAREAYEKSKFFQVYLNQTLKPSFSFDEQESTFCKIDTFDQPDYGRHYLVYYNSLDIGSVEIRLGYDLWDEHQENGVLLAIYFDLTRLEFLEYRDAVGLLQQLALAMMPFGDTNEDNKTARRIANDQMLEALWNNRHYEATGTCRRDEKPHLSITGHFTGPAGYYLYALDHWRKKFDLLAEPNRDGLPSRRNEI